MINNEGIAERTSNHLQPRVGITIEARTISNMVPAAQLICNTKYHMSDLVFS